MIVYAAVLLDISWLLMRAKTTPSCTVLTEISENHVKYKLLVTKNF